MRAATKAAFVEATRRFLETFRAEPPATYQDWAAIDGCMRQAWALHMADVARANGRGFDGAYYDPATDDDRLQRQLGRVFNVLMDGEWHTDEEVAQITGDGLKSVDAQRRHLRKPRHGSWIVDSRPYRGTKRSEYRLRNPDGTEIPPVMTGTFTPLMSDAATQG